MNGMGTAIVGLFALTLAASAAFKPPTPQQIQALVTNQVYIAELIKGATATQAVEVLVKAVEAVSNAGLADDQKTIRVAILTAIVFRSFAPQAVMMAEMLVPLVSVNVLPVMAAATAVVMGSGASPVTEAFASQLDSGDAALVRSAGVHPETILPADLILTLGVQVSHATPPGGREPTALPLAPPIREVPGTPPGPAPQYRGQ